MLGQLETWVQGRAEGVLQPDLTMWFDVAPATAAARRAAVRTPARFEAQDEAFFERVSAAYAERCAGDPRRFARLDANVEREGVWAQIEKHVQALSWA